jgi:hypothetical protein
MLIMDDTQLKAQAEHEEALAMFDRRKLMREIALPPTDKGVKLKLRSLDQAICLFGEEVRHLIIQRAYNSSYNSSFK